jgi:hypothetical protein
MLLDACPTLSYEHVSSTLNAVRILYPTQSARRAQLSSVLAAFTRAGLGIYSPTGLTVPSLGRYS